MNTSVKTLLTVTLLSLGTLGGVSAQQLDSGVTAPTAQLYVANFSNIISPVNIYLDGVLFASNVFSGNTSMFARAITAGTHQVVVTPNYLAPGVADILNTTITVAAGTAQTLTLKNTMNTTDNVNIQTGYELDLSNAQ